MSCEDVRNLALLAACGEAGEPEAAVVRQHAAHCPACAREIQALHEGLELLNHVPAEQPSAEARAALGALLLREAPKAKAARVVAASRPAWFWAAAAAVLLVAAAAAVLLVAAAGGMAWKMKSSGTAKPQEIAHKPVDPAPAPKAPENKTAKVRKPREEWSAWTPAAHEDIDSLASSIKELRGGGSATKTTPDHTAVWFPESKNPVDSMYESLDSITTTSDKF